MADLLFYLTGSFCKSVLENVTNQIITLVQRIHEVHPDFQGDFSLAGHSLGSVICWDLLAVLKENNARHVSSVSSSSRIPEEESTADHRDEDSVVTASSQIPGEQQQQRPVWGPAVDVSVTIPFVPRNTFCLGSPLGLFLTLRGAHTYFDELRIESGSAVSPFNLPTRSLYNIYNPRYVEFF